MTRSIAVIGGGPAGLSAAVHLQRAGVRVRLFEAAPSLGGRLHTEEVEGFRVEGAAQLFGSMYGEFFRLLNQAAAGSLAIRAGGRDAIWRGGRAHEVVYGSASSMLASSAVPFGLKLRLGTKYLPFLHEHADRLEMQALERAAPLDRESIGAWGERELGADFVRYLVYPLLAAGYGGVPEETGAPVYHMMARYGMGAQVYTLRGGAAAFCDALAAQLRAGGGEVSTGTPVNRVELRGGAVELAGDHWAESCDGVVLAIPAPAARALLQGQPGALGEWLGGVRYRPHLSLALLLDRPAEVEYFGLSFPGGAAEMVAVVCVQTSKQPGLVPEGKGLLVAFAAPRAAGRLLAAEARVVADAMLPELERAFPRLAQRVLRAKVYRWREGVTLFYPGYLDHLRRFRETDVEGEAPLVLAGDYLQAPTAEGAVLSGTRAAERLLRRLHASPRAGALDASGGS